MDPQGQTGAFHIPDPGRLRLRNCRDTLRDSPQKGKKASFGSLLGAN
ncbi:hypothetical protein N7532_006896 [Penicillium argentinense]|uniref:Uncharacterized protein n=1 Tax=Penicillium argentinense TaxID=1131581 RepID=A0A9W9FGX4_9EURO|nr:uncharacterized protein N7532_006896 [Penicillium argentinense]KAJ5099895.1 hypothetical protein N7532_006896 [Penicillium argentinense]